MNNENSDILDVFSKWCIDALSSIVFDKTVILYGTPSYSNMMITTFKNAGARNVIGIESKTSPQMDPSQYNYFINRELKHPSIDLLEKIGKIDSQKCSLIYAGSSIDIQWVDDRKVIGARSTAWSNLEKKVEQTRILRNQEGYKSSFISLDSLSQCAFKSLCIKLMPCVISGELANGIEMGSSHTFVINKRTQNGLGGIYQTLKNDCIGIRIASFTDGLPITVYGFCHNKKIYYYQPVVGIVGYNESNGKIVAPGIIAPTKLDVDPAVIYQSVIEICNKVVSESNYCGAFGVDGVLIDGKYIIHDYNPRICAGFSLLSKLSQSKIPHNILDLLMKEHIPIPFDELNNLRMITHKLRYCNEVVIWNNNSLSNSLTSICRHQSLNWKQQVLKSALYDNLPLFEQYFAI